MNVDYMTIAINKSDRQARDLRMIMGKPSAVLLAVPPEAQHAYDHGFKRTRLSRWKKIKSHLLK